MERYGSAQATEGSPADPVAEWSSPEGETGLEQATWQLELAGESYPERSDEDDCIYYLRTGFCGFGSRCRFNHPRDRNSVVGAMRAIGGAYPERLGQLVCQYYMRTGMCKFGASCKYHHPRQGGGLTSSVVTLNFYGYPLRLGEKECSYYVKTGHCKFGTSCKFHHPQPSGVQVPEPVTLSIPVLTPVIYPTVQSSVPSSQQYGVVTGDWPVARSALLPGSYMPGTYGSVLLPQGMVPSPGWNPYQAALTSVAFPSSQSSVGAGPIYGLTQLSSSAPAYAGPYLSMPSPAGPSGISQKEHAFPERPGQPKCQYYMKTGDCKFGSSCKYDHPSQWSGPNTNFVLSAMGLPLRPGEPLCSHYALTGVCKFGPSCKFDHPMETLSYSPSASSLSDMAVVPYPVGSSMPTLAPSSSSSELRPELISGSDKEVFPTRMSTSASTAAGSVGSIFPRNSTLPHSSIHPPTQSSTPSTGSSGTGHDVMLARFVRQAESTSVRHSFP